MSYVYDVKVPGKGWFAIETPVQLMIGFTIHIQALDSYYIVSAIRITGQQCDVLVNSIPVEKF